jgi:gliding motility-associated peptidyl-prolyl isomerase
MKHNIKYLLIGILLVSCINPIPRKPVSKNTGVSMEQSVKLNKSINKTEEDILLNIIKLDSLSNYQSSSLGFWYKYNYQATTTYLPATEDILTYTYDVFDVDYNLIYDSNTIGIKNYVVDKQEIEEGLANGLKMMHQGDVVTFLFPSHKMFGYLGDQHKININQPLIYKVQLIKINKKNESN